MCWTENRVDKVKYFKEIGLWYLPHVDDDSEVMVSTCTSGLALRQEASRLKDIAISTQHNPSSVNRHSKQNIREHCCKVRLYWPPATPAEVEIANHYVEKSDNN